MGCAEVAAADASTAKNDSANSELRNAADRFEEDDDAISALASVWGGKKISSLEVWRRRKGGTAGLLLTRGNF